MKEGGEDHLVACLHTVHGGGRHIPVALLARAEQVRAAAAESPFERLSSREAELAWMVGQAMRN